MTRDGVPEGGGEVRAVGGGPAGGSLIGGGGAGARIAEAARQIRVREELRRPDVAVRAMVQERQNLALEQADASEAGGADVVGGSEDGRVPPAGDEDAGARCSNEELKKLEGEEAA